MTETYVNKTYQDGDKDIYFPYWRQVMQREATNFRTKNLEVEQEKWKFINEKEIALKHPKTGATIKLCDDGSIEMFANADTGIRIDQKENSIIFYGDTLHFATKEMKIHTKPYGFLWNNHNFNPYLYYGDKIGETRHIPKINLETFYGQNNLPLFQEQTRKTHYDPKVQELISELGIETPSVKRGV